MTKKNKSYHALGMIEDITERKNAEKELQNSKNFAENLIQTANVIVVGLNVEGEINILNKAAEEITGYTLNDLKGKNWFEVLVPKDKYPHVWEEFISLTQNGQIPKTYENPILTKTGEARYISWQNGILKEGNKVTGIISFGIDITERKEAEEEIKKLNEELEQRVIVRTSELSKSQEALLNLVEDLNEKSDELEKSWQSLETKNKELETFTYSVSHDLKAPLREIDGYSQILLKEYEKKLDAEGQRFLRTIRESALHMNQLINDLLEYSRLERQTLRPTAINAKDLVETLISQKKTDSNFHKFTIKANIPNIEFHSDKDGLTLSLRNLIENAYKFTQKSAHPEIEIGYLDNDSKHTIFVKDNGIGFDMKFHNRIFEIFQRLHRSEEYEGTGIGLAMVKKAIERLNGKVWAESEVGKGSIFYIEIPKIHPNDNYKL